MIFFKDVHFNIENYKLYIYINTSTIIQFEKHILIKLKISQNHINLQRMGG